MNGWRQWNLVAVGAALTAALSVAAFNIAVDPYSVLGTAEWMRQGYNVNERFRKIEYLRQHIGKFDSFVLGSSTMGLYGVEPANDARKGSNWYNLAFLAGTPPEALRALKYLKSEGQTIKEAMFGIDIFAFRKVEGAREMWKREHPMIRGESWWDWYKAHVFASSFVIGIDRLMHQARPQPKMFFDVEGTGRYFLLDWEREKKADQKAFAKKMIYEPLEKRGGQIESNGLVLIQERFDELRELKEWADSEGVKIHFWINPMHWATIASIDKASLEEFRKKVKEAVGEVPDYSAREDITQSDAAFFEMKHYTSETAAQITREVLGSTEGKQGVKGQAAVMQAAGTETNQAVN